MKKISDYHGFSLLEILIATFLGLFLLEVILQSYLTAKNIYRAQDELVIFSENIRFSGFILWQTITQAGFAGCRRVSELKLHNHTVMNFDEFTIIRGYGSANIPDYLSDKAVSGSDIVVITKASADFTQITSDIDIGSTSFKVIKNPATKTNPFLLISDCENADLLESNDSLGNRISFTNALDHAYAVKSSQVRSFEETSFFIGKRLDEKRDPVYGLYFSINRRRRQELVSGISNMEIMYGISSNGLGLVTRYLKASEVDKARLWDKVLSVVIDLKVDSRLLLGAKSRVYIRLRERS